MDAPEIDRAGGLSFLRQALDVYWIGNRALFRTLHDYW